MASYKHRVKQKWLANTQGVTISEANKNKLFSQNVFTFVSCYVTIQSQRKWKIK